MEGKKLRFLKRLKSQMAAKVLLIEKGVSQYLPIGASIFEDKSPVEMRHSALVAQV